MDVTSELQGSLIGRVLLQKICNKIYIFFIIQGEIENTQKYVYLNDYIIQKTGLCGGFYISDIKTAEFTVISWHALEAPPLPAFEFVILTEFTVF